MLNRLFKIYNFFKRHFFCTFRIKTVGVRALILKDNKILLVRHTYIDGWYFPGGGVNAHESAHQAVVREVREEVGGIVSEPAKLLAAYYNPRSGWDDYVLLFKVDLLDQYESKDPEIAEARWFNIHQLPADITPSTKNRIDEHVFNASLADCW